MTTTTTADALLAAVLAHPGDDAPRHILADWWEERDGPGDAERSAFVRVQVELARRVREAGSFGMCKPEHGPDCQCTLRRLDGELLSANWRAWSHPSVTFCLNSTYMPKPTDVAVTFRRGFVETVACKLEMWTGGACRRCHGHGSVDTDIDPTYYGNCPDCHGTPRVAGVGAALVACQPVTTVRVTDREPYFNDVAGYWSWWIKEPNDVNDHPQSDLPRHLYRLLKAQHMPSGWKRYDSEAAALADMSSALLRLVKGGDA